MSRKYKKELDVLRAVNEHRDCWVSSRFVRSHLNFRSRVSGAISVGKLLSRMGFKKRNEVSTAPNEYYIDSAVYHKRLKRINIKNSEQNSKV